MAGEAVGTKPTLTAKVETWDYQFHILRALENLFARALFDRDDAVVAQGTQQWLEANWKATKEMVSRENKTGTRQMSLQEAVSMYYSKGKGFTPMFIDLWLGMAKVAHTIHEVYVTKDAEQRIRDTRSGLLIAMVERHRCVYTHTVAIRDGWVLDSAEGRVYPWKGTLEGYEVCTIVKVYEVEEAAITAVQKQ